MPITESRAKPSRKALLAAAQSMSPREFDQFWDELRDLRARRTRFHPHETERGLLARIHKPFRAHLKQEMRQLVPKLEAETLTQKQSERLRDIAWQREEWHAQRMRALVDLANLRGMTLEEAMADLGVNLPEDA